MKCFEAALEASNTAKALGFSGFRVWDSGFRVWDLGFRVLRVLRLWGLRVLRLWGF